MNKRIVSVDIFRALTMFLMVFVNDLWTLENIPAWLEHTTAEEDGMGLSDVVFPAFLFIVGLSIPFAMQARIKRGHSPLRNLLRILQRTLALVVMGFFMVNGENFRPDVSQAFRTTWEIIMVLAFLLIWNQYERDKVCGGIPVAVLQVAGILILAALALVYRGGTTAEPQGMTPHWWGILGLIGWAYLVCAILYLMAGNRLWLAISFAVALYALNLQEFLPVTGSGKVFRIIISASNHALVMSGVVATMIFQRLDQHPRKLLFPGVLLGTAILLVVYGFSVRPFGGISKILATPSWTAVCAGISFAVFALIYTITDHFRLTRWASAIMPAGRSALTCYLVPTLVYPALWPLQQLLPAAFLEGGVGLLKSLLFALLIIALTGMLEKIPVRLKI
jgi:predicted acyltransferase